MEKLKEIAKFLVALLAPVFLVIQSALTDGEITQDEWLKILVALLVALGVWAVPNKPVAAKPQD